MWRRGGAVLLVMATVTTPAAAQDAAAPAGPFRKLFVTLARDLKDLPSRENVTVLVNGAVLALAAYPFDDLATLGASSSPFLKATFSGVGKAIGREWVQGGGALAAYVAGQLWDQPRMTHVAGDLIESQLVAVTATQGLKFVFNRTRPDGEARSFPSGHASAAFATARVLQRHFGNKAAVPAYAVAVYTSASRLQANSHYASDVFFGAALGVAIAQTATRERQDARFQVVPAVTKGGAALMVIATR
jgi:hypothetical protein